MISILSTLTKLDILNLTWKINDFKCEFYSGFRISFLTDVSRLHSMYSGLANCRYVAHQSDTQGQNAPKGFITRQEITPEIAHIHVGGLQNGMIWMQSDLSPQRLHTVFSWCLF